MTARLTKARLALLMDTAKERGGRVHIDLAKGEATVDFSGAANDAAPADEEAQRLEETMKAAMGGKT